MSVFDFLKKRKEVKKRKRKKEIKPEEKPVKKPPAPKPKPKKRIPKKSRARRPSLGAKATGGLAYRILKAPHITEKSTDLARKNQYTFLIWGKAKKVEVKKAIEDIYNVAVTDVRIINVSPKRRRLGRTLGWRKGYKKAIVKVKEGQKINVFPT